MNSLLHFVGILLAFSAVLAEERVALSEIRDLVFLKGKASVNSRGEEGPQLECVGGSAGCGLYAPDRVICKNLSDRKGDIQWKCEAELPVRVELGEITVNCEGLDDESDPYVNRDSCRLQYNLESAKETSSLLTLAPLVISLMGVVSFVFGILCFYHEKNLYKAGEVMKHTEIS